MTFCGCGGSDVDKGEPQLPAWLTEESSPVDAAESETVTQASATVSHAPAPDGAALQLSLKPGDRFPLRKVVDQELRQASLSGEPQTSRSRLEIQLTLTVEEAEADHTRLNVRYDHVRYSHDVAGESVEYDSQSPPSPVPPAALAYHAMANNGFSFELGPDRQVNRVIGFREFLERCLQHVPPDQRQRVMLDIEANSGEKGLTEFVDHTIGLLPADVDKVLGDSWEKTRHVGRPIPMQINTVYTLQGLNDRFADIGVSGTITPLTALGESAGEDQGLQIIVKGGRTEGHCTIHRDTGLPKESQVTRVVDMVVQTGGIEFTQQKRTVTTVQSEPVDSTDAAPTTAEATLPRFQ